VEFIETSIFTREVEKLLSDDEYQTLQNILVLDPEAGVLIRGGGGLRKLRVAAHGKGKSGGARVLYYFKVAADQIYMLAVYAKGRKENLSAEETAQLRELVKRL
jgi:hypothetical protein